MNMSIMVFNHNNDFEQCKQEETLQFHHFINKMKHNLENLEMNEFFDNVKNLKEQKGLIEAIIYPMVWKYSKYINEITKSPDKVGIYFDKSEVSHIATEIEREVYDILKKNTIGETKMEFIFVFHWNNPEIKLPKNFVNIEVIITY